jgi:hypothetical protein
MQTSKFLLVIGAAMVFSVPSLLAAKPETEAQIKMREALRLKMEELNTQETPPAPVVEAPAPVVVVPKPEPKPVVKPVAPKPVVMPKQEEAKPKTVVVPVPVEEPVTAPAKAGFSEPANASETAAEARMRAALQQKMSELNAAPAAVTTAPVAKPQPKVVVAPEKPLAPVAPAATTVAVAPKPTQIEAPVSTLPVTKQGRLAELLRRYKADEMTAQDYHSQRAAILAE